METMSYWKMFQQTVTTRADNIAVIYHINNIQKKLNYSDLYDISNNLYKLLSTDIRKAENIGVLMKHNALLPAIIALIHRFDCTFVFLDPDESEQINQEFIKSVQISKIFTFENCLYNGFTSTNLSQISEIMHSDLYLWSSVCEIGLNDLSGCSIAYWNKTSGSTSIAKIVGVPHQCIYLNIKDLTNILHIHEHDVINFSTPLTFDPSVVELYLAVLSGAALFIVSNPMNDLNIMFPKDLSKAAGITVWQTTPSLFMRSGSENIKNFILDNESQLRVLLLGGEQFNYGKLKSLKGESNVTEVFNIYGITEVSCWASVQKIYFKDESTSEISIGKPLANTFIKVCDDNGEILTTGEGNILIGSNLRKCLVDTEINNMSCDMLNNSQILWRNTGDVGEIKKDGHIYYKGRKDRVIKRYGHKVNLLEIETVTLNFPGIDNCSCIWLPKYNSIILLYSSKSDDKNETLWTQLKYKIDKHSLPDCIHRVNEIPLSNHGKVSLSKVYNIYENILSSNLNNLHCLFFKTVREMLPFCNNLNHLEDKSFLENGGNSITSLQLINKMENITKINYSHIFSLLMSETSLKNVYHVMESKLLLSKEVLNLTILEDLKDCSDIIKGFSNQSTNKRKSQSSDVGQNKKSCSMTENGTENSKKIQMLWKINLGKCIDANPILYHSERLSPVVMVGSHSGKVVTVDALSGLLINTVDVSSRVEAPILCYEEDFSDFAVFGCYDGSLWCLSLQDFKIVWKTPLNYMIKSQACYYLSKIYAATYEGRIWSICSKTGTAEESKSIIIGKQGISADLTLEGNNIFAATLDGTVACIQVEKNCLNLRWKKHLSSPVFAKPTFLNNDLQILFTEVRGILHCLDVSTGNTVWAFTDTKGFIFSSCSVYNLEGGTGIVFGCHDHHSYHLQYLNHSQPTLEARIQHTSAIYATPTVKDDNSIICIATKGDLQIMDSVTKQITNTYKLPGEVFSSPIVFRGMVFVGCRDDNLYCLK